MVRSGIPDLTWVFSNATGESTDTKTPTPDPSPQGGGEPAEPAAGLFLKLLVCALATGDLQRGSGRIGELAASLSRGGHVVGPLHHLVDHKQILRISFALGLQMADK